MINNNCLILDKATIEEVGQATYKSIEKDREIDQYNEGYNKEFIPELHDIGKIWYKNEDKNDKLLIKLNGHTFIPKDPNQFKSASWWGQLHHTHLTKLGCWETELKNRIEKATESKEYFKFLNLTNDDLYNLFILILADHLASSISRVTRVTPDDYKKEEQIKLYNYTDDQSRKLITLWNRNRINNVDNRFLSDDDIINIINKCKDHNEFFNKYKNLLQNTPEDKSMPRNITTLYTHLALVGKIFRVLECFKSRINNSSIEVKNVEGSKLIRVKGDKGEWQAIYAECKITFPHEFVRLHDINLLAKRRELMTCIKDKYSDNVLFITSNTIILFLTEDDKIKDILKPLTDEGFDVNVEYVKADLGILRSNLIRKIKRFYEENDNDAISNLKDRETKLRRVFYPYDYKEEIKPPICDICQRREAKERIKDSIREWVCDKCWKIREISEPFREYGEEWDRDGVDVCWFKFSLNHEKLEIWLEKAFEVYLQEYIAYNVNKNVEKIRKTSDKQIDENLKKCIKEKLTNVIMEEFRPLALMVDFNEDYELMLKCFWEKLEKNSDIKRPVKDYNELGVFKYTPETLKDVINTYLDVYKKYFPDCKGDVTPINLSLFVESIKYPIRDYWRYLDDYENKGFLNIKRHRSLEDAQYTMEEIENIMNIMSRIDELPLSFLHNLLAIYESTHSNIYVEIEIFNNRDRYPQLYNLIRDVKGSAINKILTLYKLLKNEDDSKKDRNAGINTNELTSKERYR